MRGNLLALLAGLLLCGVVFAVGGCSRGERGYSTAEMEVVERSMREELFQAISVSGYWGGDKFRDPVQYVDAMGGVDFTEGGDVIPYEEMTVEQAEAFQDYVTDRVDGVGELFLPFFDTLHEQWDAAHPPETRAALVSRHDALVRREKECLFQMLSVGDYWGGGELPTPKEFIAGTNSIDFTVEGQVVPYDQMTEEQALAFEDYLRLESGLRAIYGPLYLAVDSALFPREYVDLRDRDS